MKQPIRCVILDTNAYRRLARRQSLTEARRKGTGIRARDQAHDVQALAHPLVIVELLAHLADPTDPAHDDCRSAVVALWEHCATTLDGFRQLATLEDPESQLTAALYGCCPIDNHRFVQNLATTVRLLGSTDATDVLSNLDDRLQSCAAIVARIEDRFVKDMMLFVIRSFDPTAITWDAIKRNPELLDRVLRYLDSEDSAIALAEAKVLMARSILGTDLARAIGDEEVATVRKAFACHLELYRHIVRKIVAKGCDVAKEKHRNWIWDLQIAFALGGYSVHGGLTIDLVTGDTDIADAARAARFSHRVLTFDQYSDMLRAG